MLVRIPNFGKKAKIPREDSSRIARKYQPTI